MAERAQINWWHRHWDWKLVAQRDGKLVAQREETGGIKGTEGLETGGIRGKE